MIIQKIYYYAQATLIKIFYSVIYRRQLFFGKKTTFRMHFKIIIAENGKIHIGDNCFFNHYCSISARKKIAIGNNTIMGENVKITDHNHRFRKENVPIKEQGFSEGEVFIGNNCWIGNNVIILKGANIGDNCVIGAGCVIDFEVPDNTIVKTDKQYTLIQMERSL